MCVCVRACVCVCVSVEGEEVFWFVTSKYIEEIGREMKQASITNLGWTTTSLKGTCIITQYMYIK